MFEMNQLTNEERNIMNRFSGRNMKATIRNITRMLRYLPQEELEPALSLLSKLQEKPQESRIVLAANYAAGHVLEHLTALRGWLLLGTTSQLHCYPM